MAKAGRKREVNTNEAVDIAAMLLGQRAHKHVVKKTLQAHFKGRGGVSIKSLEVILTRAREKLAERDGVTRKELRCESRQFYEALITDERTPPLVRLRAQEALDKLYGLPLKASPGRPAEGGTTPPQPTPAPTPSDPLTPSPPPTLPDRIRKFDFAALRLAMLNVHQPAEGVDAQRN